MLLLERVPLTEHPSSRHIPGIYMESPIGRQSRKLSTKVVNLSEDSGLIVDKSGHVIYYLVLLTDLSPVPK